MTSSEFQKKYGNGSGSKSSTTKTEPLTLGKHYDASSSKKTTTTTSKTNTTTNKTNTQYTNTGYTNNGKYSNLPNGKQTNTKNTSNQKYANIKAFGAGNYGDTGNDYITSSTVKQYQSVGNQLGGFFTRSADSLGTLELADYNKILREQGKDAAEKYKTDVLNRQRAKQTEKYNKADALMESANADLEKAKQGKSALGRLAVDVIQQGEMMIPDIVLGAATGGAGLVLMGVRAFAQGSQEARQNGASDWSKQGLYGAGRAAVEILTEKMFGVFGAYGKGIGDSVGKKIVSNIMYKFGKSPVRDTVLMALLEASEEGIEEIVSDVLNPIIKSIYSGTIGSNYKDLITTDGQIDWNKIGDIAYDGLVGAAIGSLGAGNNVISGKTKATVNDLSDQVDKVKAQEKATDAELRADADGYAKHDMSTVNPNFKVQNTIPNSDYRNSDVVKNAVENKQQNFLNNESPTKTNTSSQLNDVAKVVVENKQNETVSPQEMHKVEHKSQVIRSVASSMGARAAQVASEMSETSKQNPNFYQDFISAYKSGYNGENFIANEDSALNPYEQQMAYIAGQSIKGTVTERENTARYYSNTESGITSDSEKVIKSMKISKKTVRAINNLGKSLGVKVVFVDNLYDNDGNEVNGKFNKQDATITISAKAENPAAVVLGHEVLHRIRQTDENTYDVLKDEVVRLMSDDGNYTEVLQKIADRYGVVDEDGTINNENLASEEVVADAIGAIIGDAKTINMLAEQNRNLVQRIYDAIVDIIDTIKGYNQNTLTDEQKADYRAMLNDMKNMRDIVAQALDNAKQRTSERSGIIQVNDEHTSNLEAEDGSVLFSMKENKNITDRTMKYYAKHNANIEYNTLLTANSIINEMVDYMSPFLDITNNKGARYLPEEILGKTTFENGSYGRTIENTTICFRTLAYIDFTNEIKERIGRPLTVEESFLASQMLYDIAKEPQCLYCYVSLDRKAYDEFLLRYVSQRDEAIANYKKANIDPSERLKPQASKKADRKLPKYKLGDSELENIYKDYLNGREDTPNQRERFNLWIDVVTSGGQLITNKDLTTEEKRSEIKNRNDMLSQQMLDAENYAQGASWAKKLEQYRSYNGDILNMGDATVEKLNKHYGLRFYSFSEYTPAFIVENMQQIRDASVKGLYGLAYTKKPDFARIFAGTGMNINISCFGRMDNGKVVADTLQGADWEEVKALRNEHKNVGAVFVATNDYMTEWALKQDWIDVVIPFHIVRTGANVAEFYKWVNNTKDQADVNAKGKNKTISPAEFHNDYNTYMGLINKRNLTPRFNRWLPENNPRISPNEYMKLVNETRLSDKDSTPLQPIFDLDAAKKSFSTFVDDGGYYDGWYEDGANYDEAVNTVVNDINSGKRANEVDYGRQDFDASKAMQNRNKRNNRVHGQSLTSGELLSRKSSQDKAYLELAKNPEANKAELQKMVDEAAKQAGYDGVVWNEGNITDGDGAAYMPFNSDAIKSADTVTYDDNGNVIPLSERFNDSEVDIRYSKRGNGYYGYSMSNNAVDAYNNGEMPLSKWNKSAIVSAINEINPNIDVTSLNVATLKTYMLKNSSWHHTSKFYNSTLFYSVNEKYVSNLKQSDVDKLANNQIKTKSKKRNTDYDDMVDDAYAKIRVVINAGVLKTENGAVKKYISENSFDKAYEKALEIIKSRDAKKIDAWRRLPNDHWAKQVADLYDNDFVEYAKRCGGGYLSKNSNTFKELKKYFESKNDEQEQYSKKTDSDGNKLTEAQVEFFKDSKIRDENGNLRVVYHGSPTTDITVFDKSKVGSHTGAYNDKAIWFTDDKKFADDFSYEMLPGSSTYSYRRGEKGKVYDAYLNIANPFDLRNVSSEMLDTMYQAGGNEYYSDKQKFINSINRLIEAGNDQYIKSYFDISRLSDYGYDGIIARLYVDKPGIEYGVFNPNQIKSIDNLNPTGNEDIRYSKKSTDNLDELESERDSIEEELDFAELNELSDSEIKKLENRLTKINYEIDKLVAEERKATVKTPMQTILDNLSEYRMRDLYSLAEQLSNGAWDDYEYLSREDLENGLREMITERELSPLEMQSKQYGLYVRDPNSYSRKSQTEKDLESTQKKLAKAEKEITISPREARQSDINKFAKQIMDKYGVHNDKSTKDDVKEKLKDIADYMFVEEDFYDEELLGKINKVADYIVSHSYSEMYDERADAIKSYLRNKPVNFNNMSDIDKKDSANSRLLRFIKRDKNGMGIDVVYDEMQQMFGYDLFPDDIIKPGDQFIQIADALDNMMNPLFVPNVASGYQDQATLRVANDIYDTLLGETVRQRKMTYAEKTEEKHKVAMVNARYKADERVAKAKESGKKAKEDAISRLQADNVIKMRNARNKAYQQGFKSAKHDATLQKKKARAELNESAERKKLMSVARRLKKLKTTQANRAVIDELIKDLDLVSLSITDKSVRELAALNEWYYNQKQNDPNFVSDARTEEKLMRLSTIKIEDMDINYVEDLLEALKNIEHQIQTKNKWVATSERRNINELGRETIKDIDETKGSKDGVSNKLKNESLSPLRFIRRITGYNENNPLYKAFKALQDGETETLKFTMDSTMLFKDFTSDKAFMDSITGKNAETVKIAGLGNDGEMHTVEITRGMLISLYLHSLNDSNIKHIMDGGIVVPDVKLYKKGKLDEAYSNSTQIRLSPSIARSVERLLTPKEKAFAKLVSYYYTDVASPAINEVSELLKGYSLAQVANYFPINTDRNFLKSDFESLKFDGTIEGMGFLKERVSAKNPIDLIDVNKVLETSIKSTAKYVGMAIPVRNMSKLMGVTKNSYDGNGNIIASYSGSVKDSISRKWGTSTMDYIENLMTDIQSGRKSKGEIDKFFRQIQSNYAGAVLTMNLSVAMKQAASYPTAASVIGWSALLEPNRIKGKADLNVINMYTPLLWYRGLGYTDSENGDLSNGKRIPKALNWIQFVDTEVTKVLWKKAENYVYDMYGKAPGNINSIADGTDEFYQLVAEVYEQIIHETQPNYSTMERPEILRDPSAVVKAISMFKTQPLQNLNILYDAVGNYNAKVMKMSQAKSAKSGMSEQEKIEAKVEYKSAKIDLFNSISSQIVQTAVFAVMTMAWKMLRRKDDDYFDENGKFNPFEQLSKDMVSAFAGEVPFGAEIYSLFTSESMYNVNGLSLVSLDAINDLAKAVRQLVEAGADYIPDEEDKDWEAPELRETLSKVNSSAIKISRALGIPYSNVVNLFNATYSWTMSKVSGYYVGKYYELRITMTTDAKKYYDILYKAKSNPKQYSIIYQEMIKDGYTKKQIDSAMKARAKK